MIFIGKIISILTLTNSILGVEPDQQCAGYKMPCDPDYLQPCCYFNTTCLPESPGGSFICYPDVQEFKTADCVANNLEFDENHRTAILKHMDPTANPCDNFYQFACGNYATAPATFGRKKILNSFQKAQKERSNQLDETITALITSDTQFKPYRITKTLFKSCQHTKMNNRQRKGHDNLEILEKIVEDLGDWPVLVKNWNNDFNWMEFVSKAQNKGFFKLSFLFAEVQQNRVDENLLILVSPPDLEYSNAFKSSKRYQELLDAYSDFMIKVSQELGAVEETKSSEELLNSLIFELTLAKAIIKESPEILTIPELTLRWPRIQWMDFFRHSIPDFAVDLETLVEVENPTYLNTFEQLISQTPLKVQSNYAIWKVIQEAIPYVKSPNLCRLRRAYWRKVYPKLAMPPIDCVEVIKHFLPFSIYAAFIRDHGNMDVLSGARDFVDGIAETFSKEINGVDWFDEETRKGAVDKVKFMRKIVGYIDLLIQNDVLEKFYESLEISEDYLKNYQNLNLFIMRNKVRIVKKPFYSQDLLDLITYYHVPLLTTYSAKYLANINTIDMSTNILQGFFFNLDWANYINYGRAGTIIGHEMGHAFDTISRDFDKYGFINNWWSHETNEVYLEKVKCFAEKYTYTAQQLGVKINGSRTVDENMADNIGVRLAYLAYQDHLNKNGNDSVLPELATYSNNQLFWLSYASQWCSAPQKSVTNGRHLPANLRVLATVANIPEFSKDFNCPVGSNMNPRDRCNVF